MHRREQFAEVENFLLYDVHTPEGGVNEDVFAYSNRVGDRGLFGRLQQQVRAGQRLDQRGRAARRKRGRTAAATQSASGAWPPERTGQ